MGKQLAGTSNACLNLIENQQDAVVVAELPQRTQEFGLHFADATLALDRFDGDRRRLWPNHGLQCVEITRRHLIEAWRLRSKAFKVFRLTAGCDRRERPSMKSALEGYNVKPFGLPVVVVIPAGALDRRFHSFRAGVHEQNLVCETCINETLGKTLAFRHLVQVGNVPELRRLVLHGLHKVRMTVSARVHRDAGTAIEESSAVLGNKPDTFPVIECQVRSCIVSEKRSRGHNLILLPGASRIRLKAAQCS